nr:hypothetical protein [Tanacetum cinerariifolium]
MSTQQDIYAAGSKNRPHMLNKENYVPWSSHLLHYAKSRPNGKLICNSIINGPYVRRMIPKQGDQNHKVPMNETFQEQKDDELTENELKQEIWLCVQQMMKGSDIRIKKKKAKRHVTIVHQTKDLHTADYTQLYDFLKYNQKEVDELRAERLGKTNDPLALMTQLLIAQKEEAGIQLQAKEFDLMVVVADLDEIEEVNANCILMANLQQASTSGTQSDKVLVYDTNGSAEVHLSENCYDNDIFNMFTQEEHYTMLLETIPEPHQVPHNDSNVISEVSSMEQGEGTIEQHPS